MSPLTYRADIDGLRAIAVLSVVLYHYSIGGLRGGFVGVDVFFVISGFLITGIIHSEMRRGQFTVARFYERRARRIFPALFAMLLATMVAGWWLLLPSDLARLGQASVATLLFVSNGLYYAQSGYFDPTSEFNALLHTWSLGVEEQFYFGLPLLLVMIARFCARSRAKILFACAVFSFVACVIVQSLNFKATFFLSPFRAWELLLGSLLGIGAVPAITDRLTRQCTAVVALGALLGSIAFISEGIDFPGWKAAIPALATASLLHVGSSGGSRVNDILTWKPLVFVGLISYSLYLWHWPLLVLVKYHSLMAPLSPVGRVALLAAAFLLAVACYHLIERPFRMVRTGGGSLSKRPVIVASSASAVALLAIGLSFARGEGFPARVPGEVVTLDQARSAAIPFATCHRVVPGHSSACRIGAEGIGRPLALIWGDSHALAWAPGMDEVLKAQQWAGTLAVEHGCAPLLGLYNPRNPKCSDFNNSVSNWVQTNKPDRIYLIAHWFAWSNSDGGYDLVDISSGATGNEIIFGPAFGRTIDRIRPYVKEIVVVARTPGAVEALPYKLAMAQWQGLTAPDGVSRDVYRERSRSFWEGIEPYKTGIVWIDPEPWFCDSEKCRYVDEGRLLYRDAHHLSVAGAKFAARQLSKVIVVGGNRQ